MNQGEVNQAVLEAARRLQHEQGLLWFSHMMLFDEVNAHLEGDAPAVSAVVRATYYLRQDRWIHILRPGNFHYHPDHIRFRLAGFKPQSALEE